MIYFMLPRLLLGMITDYDPYTFEYVLSNKELVKEYGIERNTGPEDFGYKSEEINYQSLDSTRLNGWYIRSMQQSDKCLMLIHGRTSNRLKTMKYLALVDSLDLDSTYSVFIPDLRNSGKSQEAKTYMGYKFAEDVIASLLEINKSFGHRSFVLYGFSMGAMAVLNVLGREDLKARYEDNLVIEKVILDSPLINVKETLKAQTGKVPVAKYFFDELYQLYSEHIDGYGEQMRLSLLLDPNVPTLILQGINDQTTAVEILNMELRNIYDQNLEVSYFDGPGHVKLFQDGRTKNQYIEIVGKFFRDN